MDKTNKITITCEDWETRVGVSQAVADLLGINMLDIDDYIIRGSVLNGDLDEYSKSEFLEKYGANLFSVLENISYIAYVDTVEEPFVISLGYNYGEGNVDTYKKTISFDISDNNKGIFSLISDYSIKKRQTISDTAKDIVDIVTADKRW